MDKLNKKQLLHLIPILILISYLAWHLFAVTQYNKLQWWQYYASDFECGVLTTALGLMNDSRPMDHVLYPAVTLFNYEAALLRFAAAFNHNYHELFNVGGFENIKEVFSMLNDAVGITRAGVFLINAFWFGVMYFCFFLILKSKLFSCFWALFLITEPHVIYYNRVMRPEGLSLAFYFLTMILSVYFFEKKNKEGSYKEYLKYFIPAGLFMGLSIFSKIQIFPALIIYFGLMFYYFFREAKTRLRISIDKIKFSFLQLIANILLFPWWTMFRPDHVTPELLRRWPWSDLYGPPPGKASFIEIPIIIFIVFIILHLISLFLFKKEKNISILRRLTPLLLYLNMLLSGIILSIYLTGIGGFTSLSGYIINTQNFVYSTISNFYFAGQMDHKILNMDNFQRIYDQFIHVPFFIFSFFYVVILGFVFSLFRWIWPKTKNKNIYFMSLLMFGLAFGFDILATLRAKVYMSNYGVYSVTFYVLSLVFLMSAELKNLEKISSKKIKKIIWSIVTIVFVMHMIMVSNKFIQEYPESRRKKEGNYKLQFDHCIWHSKFFWDVVEADLYHSESFRKTREAGRSFTWGQKNADIFKQIQDNDVTQKFIVPDDKYGQLDELMKKYTHHIQYKTYLYNFIMGASNQLADSGQIKAAVTNYTQAIETFPSLPEAYQKRGEIYYRLQKYDEGYADMRDAQRLGAQIDTDTLRKFKRAASAQ